MWLKLLSVFGLGMTGLWQAIPAGFVLRVHPVAIGVASAAGSLLAAMLVLLLGERIRARLLRPRKKADAVQVPRERLIDRIWRRYGVIGFGLLAPGLTGAPLGIAIGLSLKVPTRRLVFWMSWGIALWAAGLTVAGVFGTAGVMRLLGR